ncbi:MAG: GrpB family protein [Candidatus Levybacteria bacterium]|nr:GrpB family protein [Candidatus Levybacteria bacterium]
MKISKALKKRIEKAVSEKIDVIPYDPIWTKRFEKEKEFLLRKFPNVVKRVEHFGSTAVPNLASKSIVDMLIEVTSHRDVIQQIIPVLTSLGYDYFYRPEFDKPPMYDWFIKRDSKGNRTHHLHMVSKNSKLWGRLLFRDYLRDHPNVAAEYGNLKADLSKKLPNDREAYTKAKTDFVMSIMGKTKKN